MSEIDKGEVMTYCEGCDKPLYDGDKWHAGADADLCEECAPDYADMMSSPSSFANQDGEPLTRDEAQDIFDRHIAAGGKPSDKIGI